MEKKTKHYSAQLLQEALAFDDSEVRELAVIRIIEGLLYSDNPPLTWEQLPIGWNQQSNEEDEFIRLFYMQLYNETKELKDVKIWRKLISEFNRALSQHLPAADRNEFHFAAYSFIGRVPYEILPETLNLIEALKPFHPGWERLLLTELFMLSGYCGPEIDYYRLILQVTETLDGFPMSLNWDIDWNSCYHENPAQFLQFLEILINKENLVNCEAFMLLLIKIFDRYDQQEEILLRKAVKLASSPCMLNSSLEKFGRAFRDNLKKYSQTFQLEMITLLFDAAAQKDNKSLSSLAWDFSEILYKLAADENFREPAYAQFVRIEECESIDFTRGIWAFISSAAKKPDLDLVEIYAKKLDRRFRLVRGHKGVYFFHILRKLTALDLQRFEKIISSLLSKYVFVVAEPNLPDLLTFLQTYPQFAALTLDHLKCVVVNNGSKGKAAAHLWYEYLIQNKVAEAFPQIYELVLKDSDYREYLQNISRQQERKQELLTLLA